MTAVCVLSPFGEGVENQIKHAREQGIFSLFGEAERERLGRISNPAAKALSLGGLLALERLVSEFFFDKGGLCIKRDSRGKPYFDGREDVGFNISHSAELSVAACSDAAGASIGIDIEEITEKRDTVKLSERFFGEREKAYLANSQHSPRSFFLVWTAKEALAKCRGGGLSSALLSVDTVEESKSEKAFFVRFEIRYGGKSYIMTLCSANRESVRNIKIICDEGISIYEIQD